MACDGSLSLSEGESEERLVGTFLHLCTVQRKSRLSLSFAQVKVAPQETRMTPSNGSASDECRGRSIAKNGVQDTGFSMSHITDVREQQLGAWSKCIVLPVGGGRKAHSQSQHAADFYTEYTFSHDWLEGIRKNVQSTNNCNFQIHRNCIMFSFCVMSWNRVAFFMGVVSRIENTNFTPAFFTHVQRPCVEHVWTLSTLRLMSQGKEWRLDWLQTLWQELLLHTPAHLRACRDPKWSFIELGVFLCGGIMGCRTPGDCLSALKTGSEWGHLVAFLTAAPLYKLPPSDSR